MDTQADLWFIKDIDLSDPVTDSPNSENAVTTTCGLGASAECAGNANQYHSYAMDNFNYDIKTVPIEDVRGREADFSLAVQGFTFQKWPTTPMVNWNSQEDIERIFLPAVKRLANRTLREQGVGPIKLIHACHWRMRTTAPPELTTAAPPLHSEIMRDRMAKIRPSTRVHVGMYALRISLILTSSTPVTRMRLISGLAHSCQIGVSTAF
jgi:hypothetical protein